MVSVFCIRVRKVLGPDSDPKYFIKGPLHWEKLKFKIRIFKGFLVCLKTFVLKVMCFYTFYFLTSVFVHTDLLLLCAVLCARHLWSPEGHGGVWDLRGFPHRRRCADPHRNGQNIIATITKRRKKLLVKPTHILAYFLNLLRGRFVTNFQKIFYYLLFKFVFGLRDNFGHRFFLF